MAMDALINDEFERLYQQMVARKATAYVESNAAEFSQEVDEAPEMQNNFPENDSEFLVPSDSPISPPEVDPAQQIHKRDNKQEEKNHKKSTRTEKPAPPSLDTVIPSSDSTIPQSAPLMKKKKSASLIKSPSQPPQPKRKSSSKTDSTHSVASPTAPLVQQDSDATSPPWIRAPSDPELVWPTSTISEVKGEGILTYRPCPSRAKFVFRGSLYHPDAFKGKQNEDALLKASIDLDGLWRYHLLQQSNPRDTSSMLIRQGLHPLFLRRCLRRNGPQSNRYISPATDATDEPTPQHYVAPPPRKVITQEKEKVTPRAEKKLPSKATKSSQGARTKKSSAATTKSSMKKHSPLPQPPTSSPPSSSISPSPSAPASSSSTTASSTSTKPRFRSLLAGTLPSPTLDSRSASSTRPDENTRLPLGSPQITNSGPVVHTPPVKRTKKK